MTKVCFFFFRVSRKLSPTRCSTLVCCSSHVGSGGGGASGFCIHSINFFFVLSAGTACCSPFLKYFRVGNAEM